MNSTFRMSLASLGSFVLAGWSVCVLSSTSESPRLKTSCAPPCKYTDVSKALKIELQGEDFKELVLGSSELATGAAIVGKTQIPITQVIWGIPIVIHKIDYSFLHESFSMELLDGEIEVKAIVKDLKANVDRVEIGDPTRTCRNVPISSNGRPISMTFRVRPSIDSHVGLLKMPISRFGIGLNAQNFEVKSPGSCDVGMGLDWLVSYMLPVLANWMRDEIGRKVAGIMSSEFGKVTESFNGFLTTEITLPFDVKPIRPFYLTTGIRPEKVLVTSKKLVVDMKTRFKIDPDDETSNETSKLLDFILLQGPPSSFGMSVRMLNGFLDEAYRKDMFKNILIDQNTYEGQKGKFEAGVIGYQFFPQLVRDPNDPSSKGVVEETEPYSLNVRSVEKIFFSAELDPQGFVRLQLNITDMALDFMLLGKRYATVTFDAKAPVKLQNEQDVSKIAVLFEDMSVQNMNAEFNMEFPKIDKTHSFDKSGFVAIIKTINTLIKDQPEKGKILTLELPGVKVGSRSFVYEPLSLSEDYLSIRFRIRTISTEATAKD